MSSGPGNIIIRIGAETASAITGLNAVNKSLGDTMTGGQKAVAGLKKAAVPAAAALTVLGGAAIGAAKAAAEDQAAQTKLVGQLDRVTDATAKQLKGTDAWITKTSLATGVADDELRPALGKLATATGDLGEAQKEMSLALDISAQSGKSLESTVAALAKAHDGNFGSIKKLVPGLNAATLATKDFDKVSAELAAKTHGAAAEAADTATGKFKIWQVQMQELKETLGTALLPAVTALGDVLVPVTAAVSAHTGIVKVAVIVLAALAATVLVANAALKVYDTYVAVTTTLTKVLSRESKLYAAAQWLVNAALSANPIGLAVIALAALAAAFVIAYRRSATFREIVAGALDAVTAAFHAVLGAAQAAFNWIVAHWKLALFTFGPIGAAVYVIITNFDKLKAAGEGALKAIKNAIDAVTGAIHSAIDAVKSLIDALGRIHVPHISIPNPFAAQAATPVGRSRSSGAVATSGAGGTTINVYGAVDAEGTARAILRVLASHNRRTGQSFGGLY